MLIAVEGPDGTGKSTLIRSLQQRLQSIGLRCYRTQQPYMIHAHVDLSKCDPLTQLWLFQADRSYHCQRLRQWLTEVDVVLCDRYTASTVAYQGYGHGLPLDLIHQLNDAATAGLRPDLTIWLDMPVDKSIARAKGDRLDKLGIEFYERVRQGYADHFAQCDGDGVRVWADQPEDEVMARVWAIVGGMVKTKVSEI